MSQGANQAARIARPKNHSSKVLGRCKGKPAAPLWRQLSAQAAGHNKRTNTDGWIQQGHRHHSRNNAPAAVL
ncbi:hypothetical protein BEI72_08515 [Erwinia amylovora]|nr:hypothetical protein BEI72_08515 [Erwinia amylovora]